MPDADAINPEELPSAAELEESYQAMLDSQPEPAPDPAAEQPLEPEAAPPSPLRIIEAMLFLGGGPLKPETACEIIRGFTPEQFADTIDALNREYRQQGRPYHVTPHGPGHVLTLRPRYRTVIERIYGGAREARLAPQAIDVLAVVAYRQPVAKSEIDTVRGSESATFLRQLVRRGLIAVVHRADSGQREVSYGTTEKFLAMFGLSSLEDLPRTEDLQRI